MGQLARSEKSCPWFFSSSFAIALGSRTTRRSPHINLLANISREQNKLAGALRRSDINKDEAATLPNALTPPVIFLPAKDLFTKFMKVFMATTQAQALAEP